MGKKKRKFRKTNQLSVATAEASSAIGEQEQQQPQLQSETRRKRGRPRKVIDKAGETADKAEHGIESESEKVKTGEEEEVEKEKQAEEEEVVRKEELSTSVEERGLAAKEGSTSRGRRKSKPRKSS